MSVTSPLCRVDSLVVIAAILMSFLISITGGDPTAIMYQIDDGPRSIGSYLTVISDITNGSDYMEGTLKASSNLSSLHLGYFFITNWSDPSADEYALSDSTDYLNISYFTTSGLLRRVIWDISFLPAGYNKMTLTTSLYSVQAMREAEWTLRVVACKLTSSFSTFGQNSTIGIASNSSGHYNDVGKCRCVEEDQELFYINGSKSDGIAKCGLYAEWTGCESVQCWSGPRDIVVSQVTYTVSATNPFKCIYIEGFPLSTGYQVKINDKAVSMEYILKSSDNGKNMSCEVFSNYTEAVKQNFESSPEPITVYYPPESSSLSDNSLTMKINSSKHFNYSFFANPEVGECKVTIRNHTLSAALYSLGYSFTKGTHHVYEIDVTIISERDFGSYEVCAHTDAPYGMDCALLIINGIEPDGDEPISATFIGLIIGGIALLIFTVLAIILILRRRSQNHSENRRKQTVRNPSNDNAGYELYDAGHGYEEVNVRTEYENVNLGTPYETVNFH